MKCSNKNCDKPAVFHHSGLNINLCKDCIDLFKPCFKVKKKKKASDTNLKLIDRFKMY